MTAKPDYPDNLSHLADDDISRWVATALHEDQALADATTLAIFPESQHAKARIFCRQEGIVAGVELAAAAFKKLQSDIAIVIHSQDGDRIAANKTLLSIDGKIRSILSGERTALNFLSFLSGIASNVYQLRKQLQQYNIELLDTRKTIPGMRDLSKYAVHCGGAKNHRHNLAQMGMIKDNHIAACGSITAAIQKFRQNYPSLPLEVEIDSYDQLDEVLKNEITLILLDNMSPSQLQRCSNYIKEHNRRHNLQIYCEASGGFNRENLHLLKDTGVDFVSMSSVTMKIEPLDFSLEVSD